MATFIITAGNRDAKEDGGTVVVNGNGADHDHDVITKWSGLSFVPSAGGNPAGPNEGNILASCFLTVCISTTGADEPLVTIFCEKVLASAAFTTATNNISGRTKTTASALWDQTDMGLAANTFVATTSLLAPAQEMVNQAGWTDTSPMTFLIQGGATLSRDLQYRFWEYQGVGGTDPQGTYAAILTMTWSTGGQPMEQRKSGLVVPKRDNRMRGIYDGGW